MMQCKQDSYELPKNMTRANWTRMSRNCMQLGLVQNSSMPWISCFLLLVHLDSYLCMC